MKTLDRTSGRTARAVPQLKRVLPPPPKEKLIEEIAAWLKAMADPTRLRLLHAMQDGELCVTDLLAGLECSQANVSKHLAILRSAGLVDCRREGSSVYYKIADPGVFEICRTACDSLQREVEGRRVGLARGRESFRQAGAR